MMAWTAKQKQLAARACADARISDDQRRDMILRNFPNAHAAEGRITSTAPRLNNQDYEQFMSIVENFAGGKLLHFTPGYWQASAANTFGRMRHKAEAIAAKLESAGVLEPGGAGLRGWIAKRVTKGETDRIEDLEYHGLMALIVGLSAFAAQRGVCIGGQDGPSIQD